MRRSRALSTLVVRVAAALLAAAPATAQTCQRETVLQAVDPLGAGPYLRTPLGAPVVGGDFALRVEGAQPFQLGALLLLDPSSATTVQPKRARGSTAVDVPAGFSSNAEAPLATTFFTTDAAGSSPLLVQFDDLAGDLCGTEVRAVAVLFAPSSFPSWSSVTNTLRLRVGLPADLLFEFLYVGGLATEMHFADLDDDGVRDLVAVSDPISSLNGSLRVQLGLVQGGFGAGQFKGLFGYGPQSLAIADFNCDGAVDVVTANTGSVLQPGSNASVFLGDGTGGLSANTDFATGAGSRAAAVADFDQDGEVDLVTADFTAGTLSVLLGDGFGNLASPLSVAVGVQPYDVAVGDFDQNGSADLVATLLAEASLGFVLATGPATFAPVVKHAAAVAPISVLVADFNEDGVQDVVNTNNSPGSITYFRGTGGGGFAPAMETTIAIEPMSLAVGDVDRDGHLDLAATGYFESEVSLLLGNGAGSFAHSTFDTVFHPIAIAIADVDRDGSRDLLVSSNVTQNRLCAHLARASGVFLDFDGGFVLETAPQIGVVSGDLDGDGDADIVYSTNAISPKSTVLLTEEDGTFTKHELASFAAWRLLDLSGDGILDLVANTVLLGVGDGTFLAPLPFVFPPGVADFIFADFDGDDVADMAHTKTTLPQGIRVRRGNGDGTFGAVLFEIIYGVLPTDLVAGDLNGDGNEDILFGDPTFTRIVYAFGDGNGGVGALQQFGLAGAPNDFHLRDLDGDGGLELLFRIGSSAYILRVAPDGTLGAQISLGSVGTSSALNARLADMTGDGTLDVVRADSVLPLDGLALGMSRGYCRLQTSNMAYAVDDFDLDGIPDVVIADGNGARIHYNRQGE